MTLAERLAPVARTIADARLGRTIRREQRAVSSNAAGAVDQVVDAIAKVAENLAQGAERVGDETRREARQTSRDIGEAVSDAFDAVAAAAGDAAARAGDAARDLHLDSRVEDVVKRIRSEIPTERITHLVTNLERELPTTDKDRYDRAYTRGWTRARTSFVAVGLATGVAAGIAGAFLLDPHRGAQRRAALKEKARTAGTTVSSRVRDTSAMAVDRARGLAVDRGLLKPATGADTPPEDALPESPPTLVAVMDAPVAEAPQDEGTPMPAEPAS